MYPGLLGFQAIRPRLLELIFILFASCELHPACYFLELLYLLTIDFVSMCSLKFLDQNYDVSCIYQIGLLGIYSQDLIQILDFYNIPCILWILLDTLYITLLMLFLIFFSLCFCTFHLCFFLVGFTKEVILLKNKSLHDRLFLSRLFGFILFPYE